ncbi:hypothetical protein ASE92_06675 [Pedobacter sp. Leaf41]|nr:hypothetical protein ASE92_06675 [Pedobacter sp. Leaf41]
MAGKRKYKNGCVWGRALILFARFFIGPARVFVFLKGRPEAKSHLTRNRKALLPLAFSKEDACQHRGKKMFLF